MSKPTNDAGLTAGQLTELRQLLLDARVELTMRRSGQLRARTGLVSEVEDEGDAAARAGDEDRLVRLAETEHQRVEEIDHALSKMDEGEYGLDEDTDEPIGYARLKLVPWARFAASTQEARERRG
ncbi:MAG TPA: TraR/DksA C4-type zinc finger protein [Polyangiales bacterium]|nr:TraR/DksA C4-type zinc finger protein [Polyangiales bacterium]